MLEMPEDERYTVFRLVVYYFWHDEQNPERLPCLGLRNHKRAMYLDLGI